MRQTAPHPVELEHLVAELHYKPGWTFTLEDLDRGQGSEGLTLDIITGSYTENGYDGELDAYHPERPRPVHFYMPVPPAAFDRRSWKRWLFDQIELVERHERMEWFRLGAAHPYSPNHGPGNDPYIVAELTTDVDRRTSFRGEVNA